MKQFFSYLGASLAAIAALASCNKEIDAPVEDLKGGVPFEICASTADTKTAIDGAFKTTWVVEGTADQINLYHKEASAAEYIYDNAFSAQTVDGKFSGELSYTLETDKEYQWLAKYPYDSDLTTPAKKYSYIGSLSDGTQSQKGLNSTAHLSGYYMPLVGKGTSTGTASPTINMEHASSVIEINVTNNTTEALDVTSIAFTAPESIIGQFVIDYTGETTTYTEKTYASKTATLSVTDGTIAAGMSGKFYLAIKPFNATSAQTLNVSVNGYSKDIPLTKDVTFTAGKIKKVNFNYDAVKKSAIFDFSDPESLGIKKPSSSAGTNITSAIEKGDVTLTATNGGTATRIWNSGGTCDLRVYSKGGSLTFSVPEGSVITKIVLTGDDASSGITASEGTISSGTWTGSNQSVILTATSNLKISTATVTYYLGKAKTSIIADNITNISARGESAGELTYSIKNPIDGTDISAVCDGIVVTNVIDNDGSFLYEVSTNTTTSPREGSITLTYGDVKKDVKVSQLGYVFKVSRAEVELEAKEGSSSSITVTSDFDWTANASSGAGYTFNPDVCEWTDATYEAANGETTVTITASAENDSKEVTKDLGTLTFTNAKTGQKLEVTVTQKAASSVTKVDKTATISFGTNLVKIDKQSVTGSDDCKNSWTITTVGTTSFTPAPAYCQIGSKSSAATSITFTTTFPSDAEVSSIEGKFGGFSGTAGTISLKVGQTEVGSGSLNASSDVTVTSTKTAEGNVVTVSITDIAKGVKCYYIKVGYKTAK